MTDTTNAANSSPITAECAANTMTESTHASDLEAFERWVTTVWRPDDGGELLKRDFPRFAFAAWKAGRNSLVWECGARKHGDLGGHGSMDCSWPECGCDPHVERVVAGLQECGWTIANAAAQQPQGGALTDEQRTVILDAMRSLSTRADELKESNTSIDGTWCDAEEKAQYEAEVQLIERLRALAQSAPPAPQQAGDGLTELINAYGRACRRDGSPAWESDEGRALKAALATPRQPGEMGAGVCKSCGGNDGDTPCAYPGEHEKQLHCLRNQRLAASAQQDEREARPLTQFVTYLNEHCIGQTITEESLTDWLLDVMDNTPRKEPKHPQKSKGLFASSALQVQADAGAVAQHIEWCHQTMREAGFCIDGGKCHRGCAQSDVCSRQDDCVPLSGSKLTADWKLPIPAAESDKRDDSALLDWLMHNLGGKALHAIGVITSAGCDRDAIRAAMSREQSQEKGGE